MLRDFVCGSKLASVTVLLWALLSPDLGADADPVLTLVEAMLSSIGFMVGWLGSREARCIRRELAASHERQCSREETARQQALRLNAYAERLASRAAAEEKSAIVIMFPHRTPAPALATPTLG